MVSLPTTDGPFTELLSWAGTFPIELPYSLVLSELRREYCDVFSTKLDLDKDLAKPDGPAVNCAIS